MLLNLSPGQTFAAVNKNIEVKLDDKVLAFEKAPVNEKGTVLVPFRPLFEAMGMEVSWDQAAQKVTGNKEGLTIVMTINSKTAAVNGSTLTLLQAPTIIDNYTMVPLRFIGESTQALVAWNPYLPQVLVYTEPYLTSQGLTKATAKAEIDKQLEHFKKQLEDQAGVNQPSPQPSSQPQKPVTVPAPPAGDGSYKAPASGTAELNKLQGMYYGFSPDYSGYECGGMCWNIFTFLPGNKVVVDAPSKGGPETIDCKRDSCQTYTIQSGTMKLNNGETYPIAVKSGKLYIDDVELEQVKPVKSGLTLNNTYIHRGFQGLSGISAGSTSWKETLVLRADGSFESDNFMIGNVQGGAPTTGAAGNASSGSYKISGNTIVMVYNDGKVESALFFLQADGSFNIGDKNFDLDTD
ncbi:copper amine oxidase N-terminal domain-containing protein [Paenibacillus sp. FSL R7-0273]|uniref:copper amine oxidase N-terminal domain-containing protein n=1 Tax=Paenibacillus sp. FSL R7-0273 TaxID=1536772 RepID=UPI000694016C|nr:copper amine oxidase N-terminal domain-containing protein [Paenibacillus sp. FSL R7-0273]OMF96069.1 hypothetical protein BK144_05705 [Paenibacillus sp. FSL R7-0273]